MSQILSNITQGKGKPEDLDTLEDLAGVLSAGALCALGQTAANPVLSTIRYFKDEYLAHINDKKCPAGVCRELVRFSIDPDKCEGCLRCIRECPTGAVSGEKRQPHTINQDMCIRCGACYDVCKFKAVIKH
jgi:NADP-reducing hydrogenase subunit HndC